MEEEGNEVALKFRPQDHIGGLARCVESHVNFDVDRTGGLDYRPANFGLNTLGMTGEIPVTRWGIMECF
jgi:hypothetical protein